MQQIRMCRKELLGADTGKNEQEQKQCRPIFNQSAHRQLDSRRNIIRNILGIPRVDSVNFTASIRVKSKLLQLSVSFQVHTESQINEKNNKLKRSLC